jgi:hypothetical protein
VPVPLEWSVVLAMVVTIVEPPEVIVETMTDGVTAEDAPAV